MRKCQNKCLCEIEMKIRNYNSFKIMFVWTTWNIPFVPCYIIFISKKLFWMLRAQHDFWWVCIYWINTLTDDDSANLNPNVSLAALLNQICLQFMYIENLENWKYTYLLKSLYLQKSNKFSKQKTVDLFHFLSLLENQP